LIWLFVSFGKYLKTDTHLGLKTHIFNIFIHPQLFEDIMNILDPEMNMIDDDEDEGSLVEEEEEEEERESIASDKGRESDRDQETRAEARE